MKFFLITAMGKKELILITVRLFSLYLKETIKNLHFGYSSFVRCIDQVHFENLLLSNLPKSFRNNASVIRNEVFLNRKSYQYIIGFKILHIRYY